MSAITIQVLLPPLASRMPLMTLGIIFLLNVFWCFASLYPLPCNHMYEAASFYDAIPTVPGRLKEERTRKWDVMAACATHVMFNQINRLLVSWAS